MKKVLRVTLTALTLCIIGSAIWLAGYTSPGKYLCAADEPAVSCVRSWVDPIAALFTVLAIWYASRQLSETRRQTDSSVRVSLVSLREDLELALAAIQPIEAKCDEIYYALMLPHETSENDAASSFAKRFSREEMFRFRELINDPPGFAFHLRQLKSRCRLSPELRLELLDVVEYFEGSQAFQHYPVKVVPKFTEDIEKTAFNHLPSDEGETIVIHDYDDGFVGLYLQQDGQNLLSSSYLELHDQARKQIRKFSERLSFEHLVAADALSEIDLRATASARARHSSRWAAAEKRGRVPRH